MGEGKPDKAQTDAPASVTAPEGSRAADVADDANTNFGPILGSVPGEHETPEEAVSDAKKQ